MRSIYPCSGNLEDYPVLLCYIKMSVLLLGETGLPKENIPSPISHWQMLSHTVVWSTLHHQIVELTHLRH